MVRRHRRQASQTVGTCGVYLALNACPMLSSDNLVIYLRGMGVTGVSARCVWRLS
eukprot:SAG31_NODE_34403_length_333_cov_0.884615_1_plen_54_part_01